jgi:hypothetical protein
MRNGLTTRWTAVIGSGALLAVATAACATSGGQASAGAGRTSTVGNGPSAAAAFVAPQLAAAPVVIKQGTTFEVRVKFKRQLPEDSDGTGVRAEFDLGPSTTDHDPVTMRGSRGFCYRQTLYNDLDKSVLRKAHAGSTLTLKIVVHRHPPAIVKRVKLVSDPNAVPPGCVLHQ